MTIKIKISLLITVLLGIVAGYLLITPENIGICDVGDKASCIYPIVFNIAEPLFFGLQPALLVILILFFLSDKIIAVWRKISYIYIPIAVLMVISTPISGACDFCPPKETVSIIAGWGYFFLTIIVAASVVAFDWCRTKFKK